MDPARSDVDSVSGQPEGTASLSLLPLLVAQLDAGEDVGAYEGGVFAAEEGEAGVLARRSVAYVCIPAGGCPGCLGSAEHGARGRAVPTTWGQ
ncbi:hypothetical protein AQJ91_13910 [Streptomyces dysideae]|uniref:Uncharacterized protein n=1 Tax=Streptomyces dysideae TaxID=909626 RepID=A0A101V143_9ACTN|nr:hypothetical protein AQJ91_13910 [Streptomyces dysideae]